MKAHIFVHLSGNSLLVDDSQSTLTGTSAPLTCLIMADLGFPRGAPTYYLANFFRKLHENEKVVSAQRTEHACAPIDQPINLTDSQGPHIRLHAGPGEDIAMIASDNIENMKNYRSLKEGYLS